MPVSKKSEPFAFESWCHKELTRLLGFAVGDDLITYLTSIESKRDVQEYLDDLLGTDKKSSRDFQREFFARWHPPERPPVRPSKEEEELLTKLVRPKEEEMLLFSDKKSKKKETGSVTPPPGFSAPAQKPSPTMTEVSKIDPMSVSYDPKPSKSAARTSQTGLISANQVKPVGGKQKQAFVPLMSAEGQSRATMQLPSRHGCSCLAQKHALVNNCIECGRIVCAQEGTGPCLFCGAFVCSPEEQELFNRESKKGRKFRDQYMQRYQIKEADNVGLSGGRGLDKAIQLKQKLLEFDQTSIGRTKVIDDEMDYFSVDSNRWISQKEREKLRKKEEELREKKYTSGRNQAITLDFAGRKVVEESSLVDIYREEHATEALGGSKNSTFWESQGASDDHMTPVATAAGSICNPAFNSEPPEYRETHREKRKRKKHDEDGEEERRKEEEEQVIGIARLQDSALQEMRDEGRCLSMHQPWASLLVAGIKRHEGRTWYSTHRGRLWIAAAAKNPDPDEIRKVESFYRTYYKGVAVSFPSSYPTGCLLGCVDMVDCLSREDYCQRYPDGESESPFVFIMENPCQLTVKFPVKGQHKIWKLDSSVHVAAKRQGCKPAVVTPSSL